jgi:hypothetical protein
MGTNQTHRTVLRQEVVGAGLVVLVHIAAASVHACQTRPATPSQWAVFTVRQKAPCAAERMFHAWWANATVASTGDIAIGSWKQVTHSPVWIRKSISPRCAMRAIWLQEAGKGFFTSACSPHTSARTMDLSHAPNAMQRPQAPSTNRYAWCRNPNSRAHP